MTLGNALTPAERANYIMNGVLPSRFRPGPSVVMGAAGPQLATNRRRSRKRKARKYRNYRLTSRWKYLLEKMLPAGFGKTPTLSAISDFVNSELGQQAIKMGVSALPGGGAAVTALENKSQIQSALAGAADLLRSSPKERAEFFTMQNMKKLATSDAGQAAIKMGVGCLPGGGAAVRAYETGSKIGLFEGLGKKKRLPKKKKKKQS